jgi:hypothetical protein
VPVAGLLFAGTMMIGVAILSIILRERLVRRRTAAVIRRHHAHN